MHKEKLTSHIIAKMIDHSMLAPDYSDKDLAEDCRVAREYDVATVCVKPYHVKPARELLTGSDVAVCGVVGFPHGNSKIEIKAAEARIMCEDGADEVDLVVNIGKVIDRDWDYIKEEIGIVRQITKEHNALLKVIFENDMLHNDDELKIKLCEICSELKVDFVKTSTGYCFNKEPDGRWSYNGATDHDLALMRKYSAPEVQVKAAGKCGDLDTIIRIRRDYGVTRIGTHNTVKIIAEAKKRFGE